MYLSGRDVTEAIRENAVSALASKVAALPAVREFLLDFQRRQARERDVVMDGRDIGTVVLPRAGVKIFLTAAPEARAERRLLELRQADRAAYQARERALRQQIANVSHDLRTPLTSILGYLQLLESERLTSQQRRHYLEIVSDRARVLQDLITAFYDLSRIEGGEYPLDLQPVDLRRALEPLLAGFYEDFERAGFQVTVELDEHLPPVLADPGAVTRILTNLIGNALKHGRAALTIRLYASGGQLVTAFSNDAPGLSPEDLSRVFERFYTADQMRTGQNTGLGLAIVKALAQRMGHTPFAELDDGTFTVGVRWKPLLPSSREAPRPLQIN